MIIHGRKRQIWIYETVHRNDPILFFSFNYLDISLQNFTLTYLSEKDVPGLGRRGATTKMSGHAPLLGFEPSGLSKDRRRFIIISIFDATLTTLLWLLCTVGVCSYT